MRAIGRRVKSRTLNGASFLAAAFALLIICVLSPAPVRAQWTASGTNISNSNTGNVGVGVGTTAPGDRLEVYSPAGNQGVRITNGGNGSTDYDVIRFFQGGGERATVFTNQGNLNLVATQYLLLQTAGGNVGIGTSTPANALHVNNSSGPQGIRVSGSGAAWMNFVDTAATANQKMYQWRSEGGLFRMTLVNDNDNSAFIQQNLLVANSSGNVGVGTATPGSKLFVGSGTPAGGTLAGLNVALGGSSYISASNGTVNTFIGSDTSSYGIIGTLTNHPLGLRANNALAVTVLPDGRVGIGTQTPSAKLDINGDINVAGNIKAKYQDVAEWVPSAQKLSAGTVVVLDAERTNHVVASTTSYDTKVAGVVSERPGISLGEAGVGKALVATTGRVKVKVDATRSPIHVGDLLVTSDVEGVAMKSEPLEIGLRKMHAPGTIIGKALEPLASGTGEILVLLSLQ